MTARLYIDKLFEVWSPDEEEDEPYSPDTLVRRSHEYAVIGFVGDVGYALRGDNKNLTYHSSLEREVKNYLTGKRITKPLFIEGSGVVEAHRKRWEQMTSQEQAAAEEAAWRAVSRMVARARTADDIDGKHMGEPGATFWDGIEEIKPYIERVVGISAMVIPRLSKNPNDWYVAAQDWEGMYYDLDEDEEEVVDAQRRADMLAQQQMHLATPEVKAAMGYKPQYVKTGPDLATRQKAMTSESK